VAGLNVVGSEETLRVSPLGLARVRVGCVAIPARTSIALVAGLAAFTISAWIWAQPTQHVPPDIALIWTAGRVWLDGGNPYLVRHTLFANYYPPTALVLGLPLTLFSLYWATAVFVGIGVGAFVYAVWPQHRYALLGIVSCAGIKAIALAQWSPLLIAGALLPSLGFVLAAKPTIAAALWLAYPSRRTLFGAALFGSACLALWPGLFWDWLAVSREADHFRPLVLYPWGGPLLLLAALRWREADCRLLLALACLPRTPLLYDALPLFLIPKSWPEALILFVGTAVAWPFQRWALQFPWDTRVLIGAYTELWCVFLPCLVILWRRRKGVD
jgi:glucose-6-phosphate-specific signal transduction histidine kinase